MTKTLQPTCVTLGAILAVVHSGCGLYGIGNGGSDSPECTSEVSTGFEFNDNTGVFVLSEGGNTVTFESGTAQTVGNFGLYRSGHFAWMVAAGETGTIRIKPPAQRVRFFVRDQFASNNGAVAIFDPEGSLLESFDATTRFSEFDVAADSASGGEISVITLDNHGTMGFSVIDDFVACFDSDNGGRGAPLEDPISESISFGDITIDLETVASGLVAPNWGISAPGRADRLFVADQAGQLWAIPLDGGERTLFLDVSDRLVELGIAGPGSFDERGLLGAAFHPDYATNGRLYTYTSEPAVAEPDFTTMPAGSNPDHQSVIIEWTVRDPSDPASVADPSTARELLRIDQPQFNHNAGALNFGPDGYLYIALGDGGGADDGQSPTGHSAEGNGQDATNPLGALLRIDSLGENSANGQYGIPADNPFVVAGSAEDVSEIFAYGLRNPFRFSFDTATGALYLADVGQNDIEELNIIRSGGNYGWRLQEGTFSFDANGEDDGFVTASEGAAGLIDPIAQYDHDEGLAIIGGFVYRGSALPELAGRYVFGDFTHPDGSGGRLFYLDASGEILELQLADEERLGLFVLGFGQDASGEIFVLANETATPSGDTGVVLRIVPATN